MTEKLFTPSNDIVIDAKLMEKWLGGSKIESLNPKTLFDIQLLLSHYKDIIVPMTNVKVEYPTEGFDTACASVDRGEIFIPTSTLNEGKIDDTIGLVIHELNHIKMSEKESTLMKICASYLLKVMDSIFIEREDGKYDSIKETLFANSFNFQNILDGQATNSAEQYFGECLKGVMLLLNAVEDVRIDSLCAPNMKNYIDKLDVHGSENFIPYYESGELDENKLMNIVFRLLYHHKGFIKDEFIDKTFGELSFILKSQPKEYIPVLLTAYQNEIKEYCELLFNNTSMDAPDEVSAMNSFVQQITESSAEEAFEKSLEGEKQFADDNFPDDMFEDSEMKVKPYESAQTPYTKQLEEKELLLAVPSGLKASIDIFRNVDVVDCFENFNGTESTSYKTLLIG